MFEKLLKSAFDAGSEVFLYMSGFPSPLRGRVQDMMDDHFTFFQNGRSGTILWVFRLEDILSCGLIVGPPIHPDENITGSALEESSLGYLSNENDN
ncbi:MAG TPA: hypothetical protein V6C99_09085 [Oculatellaceae cyanobacterium]|jgi:hypothetical protein